MARPLRSGNNSRWYSSGVLVLLVTITWWMAGAVRLAEIPSKSMVPTFRPGDLVLMRIDAYKHRLPGHGEIVFFRDAKSGELMVKRVVGVAGDEVGVSGGAVWLNGRRLREPYVDKARLSRRGFIVRLQEDQLWVMGDNRENSSDSREFGPIERTQLVGRAAGIVWPPKRRERLTANVEKAGTAPAPAS